VTSIGELGAAAHKAVALAQQEKSTWTRADVVKYLGCALPALLAALAAKAVMSSRSVGPRGPA
jgi:hypothetical protein